MYIATCFPSSQTSREQLPVAWFAQSLLVIPKTLSVNAALDSTDLVSKLRAFHNASQTMGEREDLKWWVWLVLERGVGPNKVGGVIFGKGYHASSRVCISIT